MLSTLEARQRVLILASDVLSDLLEPVEHPGPVERWLLPRSEGDALLELGELMQQRAALFRIFVHDDQVKLLRRWQRVLQHPAVRVVLFEGSDELSTALNLLNALGARVSLDVTAICRTPTGVAQLARTQQRFITDPLWKIELNPLAAMLRAGLSGRDAPWVDRWLLPPCEFAMALGPGLASRAQPYAREVVRELQREEGAGRTEWSRDHAACAACDLRPLCGGQLSARGGAPCSTDELACVERIQGALRELQARLMSAEG